jgi:ATP-dependent 26S proteasome regulatory subunit
MTVARKAKQPTIMQMTTLPNIPSGLLQDRVPFVAGFQPTPPLQALLREWEHAEQLAAAGVGPTLSALFSGPPGTGKTTAARWLRDQLRIPMVVMMLSDTIESYMGATGRNIGKAIQYAQNCRCILLLDEFDAIGAARNSHGNDSREMGRVVTAILQHLDLWHASNPQSLIIAATNLAQDLDPAITRRFETRIGFDCPPVDVLESIAGTRLASAKWAGYSHAEMARLALIAKRRAVLGGVAYDEALLLTVDAENGGLSQ